MSAPSTVLMSADTEGGTLASSLELSRGLTRRGFRVTLAVMGAPLSPTQRQEAGAIAGLALHERPYRLEWMEDAWEDVIQAGEWLLGLEERERPDVVHLHGCVHGALPFRAPRLVVASTSVLAWHRAVLGQEAPARWDRYRLEATRGLAAAHAVVAPTRAMLDDLTHDHGVNPRTRIIPHGRDPDRYRPGVKESSILAMGRLWDPAKNIAALEAVAPRLSWPVRVAGSGVTPDGVERPVAGVERLGVLSAEGAAAALGRASIYARPARYEPFGLSIVEAALSGCALVLGDIPGMRELWSGAALFVDPGDRDDLERALRCLAQHPPVRAALATRARNRALSLSPERMTHGYLALYRELMARPARPTERPRSA